MNSEIYAMTMWDPDGPGSDYPRLVLGGTFSLVSDATHTITPNRIAVWDPRSRAVSSLGTGMDSTIHCLAALPDGTLVAGGTFATAGGVSAASIARWNGTAWSPLGGGMPGGLVNAVAVMPNGDLIAGGVFATAGGVAVNNIARWDGASWHALGTGMSNAVYALAVMPNGDLIAGGSFNSAGGVSAIRIARWNGSTWLAMGPGMNGQVRCLAVTPGGELFVGGTFTNIAGQTINRAAIWFNNIWYPATFNSALPSPGMNDTVSALIVVPPNYIAATGDFTSADGENASSHLALWNGLGWQPLGGGLDNPGRSLTMLSPLGDLLVAGLFQSAGGLYSPYIARNYFGGTTPEIAAHPEPAVTCPAGSATFSVRHTTGGPGPLVYQWQVADATVPGGWRDLEDGPITISGQTHGTFSGARTHQGHWDGEYGDGALPVVWSTSGFVRCTISNPCGSATSNPAKLTICHANLDNGYGTGFCDGGVDISDLLFFLAKFESGSIVHADLDDGTGTGMHDGGVDISDLLFFLAHFEAGC